MGMGLEFSFVPLEHKQFLKNLRGEKKAAARGEHGAEGF